MKRKIEFSKLIFAGVSVLTVAVTVFSCIVIWRTGDTAALAYLIPAVFAECSAATGFYFSKAKAENQIKLGAVYSAAPNHTQSQEAITMEEIKMDFSTTEGEDTDLSAAAMEELSDNKGEDEV